MLSHSRPKQTSSSVDAAFALLLLVGLYFPSSINGEHSASAILSAFILLLVLLAYLACKLGIRTRVMLSVSIPVVAVLLVSTFYRVINAPVDFDAGLFLKFSVLALVLGLNLRNFRPGPLVGAAFLLANVVNLICGAAVLAGSEWVADFLPSYYWTSASDLVPLMLSMHKPILTFGSHALAGLFTYLFFWVNWENYRMRRNSLALLFALCYFVLLLALTSFTSLGLATLAAVQVGVWCWKRGLRFCVVFSLSVVLVVVTAIYSIADQIDVAKDLPQFAELAFFNGDRNGPLSRYGPEGTLRPAVTYLFEHPFSPIGLSRSTSDLDVGSAVHFFVGDSGPLEYLLRGSVPLLFLIYFGVYRFLRWNLAWRSHWVTLFAVILFFETGFSALTSSRTLFLLPFFVVYLNHAASVSVREPLRAVALSGC